MVNPRNIAEVMGGAAILGRRIRSIGDLEKSISNGLPKRALSFAVERIYLSTGEARRAIFVSFLRLRSNAVPGFLPLKASVLSG
jgi:hypothetical protein